MLWLAVLLVIVGAVLAAIGIVLFTNGIGVAPHNRTAEDPTGVKRAASVACQGDGTTVLP